MGVTPLRALAAEPFKPQMVSKDFESQIRSHPRNGFFDALAGCGCSYPA
jgi:hypothetical protein